MSTITLPNIRVSSDLEIRLKLKDGGVAIDWSTLTNIKASIYSDRQRSLAGRCDIEIDEEDSTILVCRYSANKPQYPGVNRVIVCCTYDGETKTYDKPAFTFVRWTDDQAGQSITIDDPDIDVEITVEDISSSILQEAVEAANSAAERANDAAAAAEHMVDIHTGPAGKSPYVGENGHWYEWDEETEQYVDTETEAQGETGTTPDITIGTVTTAEPGTPAAATMTGTPEAPVLNLTIPKGVAGDTPAFTVGEVTTGQPGTPVVVTITGTAAAPVLNITIPQGMQGNTGSSVDYPYELVNNLTTNDATKGLTAAQGKVLKDEISQLEAEMHNLMGKPYGVFEDSESLPEGDDEGYALVGSEEPFALWYFDGNEWTDTEATVTGLVGPQGMPGIQGIQGPMGIQGPVGPQGQQGNPGSSVDYPFTLANNCTTTDTTKALAAPQGVYLDGKIDQTKKEMFSAIVLEGFGTNGAFNNGNWEVGELMYKTDTKKIRRCTAINAIHNATAFEDIPFDSGATYYNKQDTKYYEYDGTGLAEIADRVVPLEDKVLSEVQDMLPDEIQTELRDTDFIYRLPLYKSWMNSAQKYYTGDNNLSVAIPVTPGDVIVFDNNGTGEVDAYYSVLKSLTNIDVYNGAGDFCTDINTRQTVAYGASATVTIPSDANFVLVGLVYNGVDTYQFSSIKINGVEYVGGIIDMLNEIVSELRDKDEPIYPFYTAKSVITKMTDYTTLISKYDELVTLYPNILTKTQLGTTALGTPLYEYVLTTGAYNSAGSHASAADVMQKPKILLTTGMHGNENGAISSMLELFTDLVTNDALLSPLKSGLEIHLIPCVNPDGFNNGTRYNSNTVDINRNFNWNWAAGGGPVVGYHGTTAADQAETQIVQTWMAANNDAVLYLDFHNDTANDISYIYSFDLTEPICQGYKKAYLMAVNTLVSYLVKVIGLPYTSVFGYSTTFHDGGGAMCYAQNVVGLSSLLMETKTWLTGDNGKGTKTIRTCASILGNSLLNIYNFFLSLVPTGKVEQSS